MPSRSCSIVCEIGTPFEPTLNVRMLTLCQLYANFMALSKRCSGCTVIACCIIFCSGLYIWLSMGVFVNMELDVFITSTNKTLIEDLFPCLFESIDL